MLLEGTKVKIIYFSNCTRYTIFKSFAHLVDEDIRIVVAESHAVPRADGSTGGASERFASWCRYLKKPGSASEADAAGALGGNKRD